MSLSFHTQDISNEIAASLSKYIKHFSPTTTVVLETNKRTVIKCLDRTEAKDLAYNLRGMDYDCFMKAGLKTKHWYIQVSR